MFCKLVANRVEIEFGETSASADADRSIDDDSAFGPLLLGGYAATSASADADRSSVAGGVCARHSDDVTFQLARLGRRAASADCWQ